ncbi:putative cyclophilin type peptidyl-prolyl cis-trans isomerase [Diplogelasinospora grovesii]|uniref:Peptidyl-prolyl cis-trans isomerase-like 2 n=1 Tax=Diplogelasinospora grovesii TaxID=303347 RepID=A0AAN6NF16_9PEZI|nr:putative cyclophilin type peptidyl-prolyl cis-trans isomerase [Diplogelasinospora grovesii]
MGKGDKLYIKHSEWASSDAYGASHGSNAGQRAAARAGASFRKLPFNFCAASLQPFKNPVCTPDGTIFDVEVIGAWLEKHQTNPVNGEPLSAKDLIKLNFARNGDTSTSADSSSSPGEGEPVDPVTFKVFTDNTHIVAIRHGSYANVFAYETVERMNIKPKMWRDLVDDVEFTRKDIITLQDPQNISAARDLSQFAHLKDGGEALPTSEQEAQRNQSGINVGALGRIGEKVLKAKEAVQRARKERESGAVDVNHLTTAVSKPTSTSTSTSKPTTTTTLSRTTTTTTTTTPQINDRKVAYNAAAYTTGKAAASFTSTGLTPSTSGERALLSDEEWMLKPKRIKNKGYCRIETNLGDLTIELQPEFAPKAVWNFIRLSQSGYYKDVAFHRNIRNFMIQGGDPSGTGRGGQSIWGKNFNDEFEGPLVHDARGVVSMANKGKNTNSSQFFILYKPARHLDKKHTIFGKVVSGLAALQKMEDVETDGSNRPLNKIVIKDVVVFVDPFEEFMREKNQKEGVERVREEIKRRGGTDDDKTTWTGKRLRNDDGTQIKDGGGGGGGVGKYLKNVTQQQQNGKGEGDIEVDTWEEQPTRKKVKTGGGGGFGNFDNW